MKKEDIITIAQLLSAIKEDIGKIKEAQKNKDVDLLTSAKREILGFQRKLTELLSKNDR